MPGDHALETGPVIWKLLVTLFFVLLNGFFVSAEFALVKVRGTRIEALVAKGDSRARVTQHILGHLDRYLSACQLGITLASLILGWLAEPAIATLLIAWGGSLGLDALDERILHGISLAVALSIVTILHMVIGEQAPKMWAIQEPEAMALRTGRILAWFTVLFRPAIWLINTLSNGLLRLLRLEAIDEHAGAHDVDELRAILRAATRAGRISTRQRAFGENILGLMRLQVRHVMLPRVDVSYLSTDRSLEENLAVIRKGGHSRFPLCEPDLDHAAGLIHVKDLFGEVSEGRTPDLKALVRPIPSVPDTQPLSQLILDLQREQTQAALVVDEHGTTVGLAFLEDALEEIVGPIHDEFDLEKPWIDRTSDDVLEMAGAVPLPEAAELLDLAAGTEEDTIGGYVVSVLGRLPAEGDTVDIPPYVATVLAMSRRRVARLRFQRKPEEDGPAGPGDGA